MKSTFTKQPVFLCGMMGSGKSTVGKTLAKLLGTTFTDLDSLIEEQLDMTIPEIFEKLGEDAFRKTERDLLLQISRASNGVVALGGGSLQNQHTVDHIKLNGRLVFLKTSRSTLVKRLQNRSGRPMLKSAGSEKITERIDQLMKQRLPYYSQAHITIETENLSKEEIAKTIITQLANYEQ